MYKSVLTEHMLRGYINKKGEFEIFLVILLDLCIRIDCGPQISTQGGTKLSNIWNLEIYTSSLKICALIFFDGLLKSHKRNITMVTKLFLKRISRKRDFCERIRIVDTFPMKGKHLHLKTKFENTFDILLCQSRFKRVFHMTTFKNCIR